MQKQPSNPYSERARELRDLLKKANHAYYVLDSPLIEDSIYDRLYKELLDLEKNDPGLITPDSPSQRVGDSPLKSFNSIKHRIPLLSLDNAFNLHEIENWFSRIQKLLKEEKNNQNTLEMVCELKIDGNALALTYHNGLLVRGSTRGDGTEGEEITANVKTISSIPLSLHLDNPPPWLEVRGEAFIPNHTFEKINHERIKNGEPRFANPRNACAGTLRQLNPKIVASRHLDFFAYTIHLPKDWVTNSINIQKPKNQCDALSWLKESGFKVNPNTKLINNLEEVNSFFKEWDTRRHDLPYATDGVVLKVNNFDSQNILGFTQKAPRWAIAIKYPAQEAPTKLISLSYQVGRTGAVTPVAEFQPVSLAGTSVSRATLHNANRIESLDLHVGDTIVVRKAGEIIPEVVRVLNELRPKDSNRLFLPENCPECQTKLLREFDQAVTRCNNKNCPAILKGVLKHWVGKGSLDIDGLGSKLIDQLVSKGLVNSISSLYKINESLLVGLERMGGKSAQKVITELNKSKKQPWHRKLYGLGILHVGESTAKILAKQYPNIKKLMTAVVDTPEEIAKINGIGSEIIESLQNWFSQPNNKMLIVELQELGISLSDTFDAYSQPIVNPKIDGKTFVITGTLDSLNRRDVKDLIEKAGGKVNSNISSKTSFILVGKNAGSKLNKAQELGIEIIKEEDLKKILSL